MCTLAGCVKWVTALYQELHVDQGFGLVMSLACALAGPASVYHAIRKICPMLRAHHEARDRCEDTLATDVILSSFE